jgi:ribosomal RNA-processing protein 12
MQKSMDLKDLHHSLPDGKPPPRPSAAVAAHNGEEEDANIFTDLLARHQNSRQPESVQLCIVASAVVDVVRSEGLRPTPTALFAALMSSLERPETIADAGVAAAMCTLLSSVLARVPNAMLKGKFAPSSRLLSSVLEARGEETTVAKPALACLCQVLAALNPADWPSAALPFATVLTACLDRRPKLRKKAHSGLAEVLAGLQPAPSALAEASDAVLKLCQRVLPGPEAAARAAAAAPSKKRQQAEDAIALAVTDALHLLGAIKLCLPLLSGEKLSTLSFFYDCYCVFPVLIVPF